ncbi:putative leucine-rich repeat-containing protein DDB_G0290503 [Bactrocera oleae]|uniref:putative leucine-rich repeat-containing protein DDB_G0290503 n=1 Tax=Bactrocera oleae TaxID=104688 RepID=UPI00387E51A7
MCQLMRLLLICLIGLGFLKLSPAQVTQDNTSESIRSLIYSFSQLDNKLERHEYRERALGELIKKSLLSLHRGQERLYSQSHFDERISSIEHSLIVQERFFSRIEQFFTEQDKKNQQLLDKLTKLSLNVEKLLDNSNDMIKPSQGSYSSNPYPEQILLPHITLNDMLRSYEVSNSSNPTAQQLPPDSNLLQHIQRLCAQPKPQDGLTNADKEFLQELANNTYNLLYNENTNVQNMVQKSQTETTLRLQEVEQSVHSDAAEILKRLNIHEISLQQFHSEMISSYNKVNDSFENLSRCHSFSKPLTQDMDSIVTDKQPAQLLDFLKTHFDTVQKNMTSIQLEVVKSLSSTIKNEISYLWRQISITNGEINDSRDLLRLMRERNEIFVNSILQSLAAMTNKMEGMKESIMDMSDNQNYLSNKLPLMPQEFADMQQAFIGWLEQLSKIIKILQEKKGMASKNF